MKHLLIPSLLMASATLVAPDAFAQSCESNFKKTGNIVNGTQFSSSVRIPGLTKSSAVAQLQNIAVAEKLDVLSLDADAGSLLLEEPATTLHKAIPVVVSVAVEDGASEVQLSVRIGRGAMTTADAMKTYVCKLLNPIKPIKAPKVAKPSASSAKPIAIEAIRLAADVERAASENVSSVNSRYGNRRYLVKGWVGNVHPDGDKQVVVFKRSTDDELTVGRQTGVFCVMAPRHKALAMAMRTNDRIQLVGEFDRHDFSAGRLYLRSCEPAK